MLKRWPNLGLLRYLRYVHEALLYRHGYGCDETLCEFCELLRAKRNKKYDVVKENWKYEYGFFC